MTIEDGECGIIIPQKVYVATADFIPNAIIKFWQYGRRGVSMEEAIRPEFIRGDETSTGMTNGNDPAEISANVIICLDVRLPSDRIQIVHF